MKLSVWKAFIGRYPCCLPGWERGLRVWIINSLWRAQSSTALICISTANEVFAVSDQVKVVRKPGKEWNPWESLETFPSTAQGGKVGTAGQHRGSQARAVMALLFLCSVLLKRNLLAKHHIGREDIKLCHIRSCLQRQIQMCSLI